MQAEFSSVPYTQRYSRTALPPGRSVESEAMPSDPAYVDPEPRRQFDEDDDPEDHGGTAPPPYNPHAISPPPYRERNDHRNDNPNTDPYSAVLHTTEHAIRTVYRIRLDGYRRRRGPLPQGTSWRPWALRSAAVVHEVMSLLGTALVVPHPQRVTRNGYARAVHVVLCTLLDTLGLVADVVAGDADALAVVAAAVGHRTCRASAPLDLAQECIWTIELRTAALAVWPLRASPAHTVALARAVETTVGFLAARQPEDVHALAGVFLTLLPVYVRAITAERESAQKLGPIYCEHARWVLVEMGYEPRTAGLREMLMARLRGQVIF